MTIKETIALKRGLYTRARRKKFLFLKHTHQLANFYKCKFEEKRKRGPEQIQTRKRKLFSPSSLSSLSSLSSFSPFRSSRSSISTDWEFKPTILEKLIRQKNIIKNNINDHVKKILQSMWKRD